MISKDKGVNWSTCKGYNSGEKKKRKECIVGFIQRGILNIGRKNNRKGRYISNELKPCNWNSERECTNWCEIKQKLKLSGGQNLNSVNVVQLCDCFHDWHLYTLKSLKLSQNPPYLSFLTVISFFVSKTQFIIISTIAVIFLIAHSVLNFTLSTSPVTSPIPVVLSLLYKYLRHWCE